MRGRLVLLVGTLIVALLFSSVALPQGAQTGGITGIVKDSSGGVLPGSTIEIFNLETGERVRTLTTGPDGGFSATLLPPGTYRLQLTAKGFKQYRVDSVPVRINEATRQDAVLEIGSVQQSIVVEAQPTLVNTESPATGQPIDAHTLTALPLPVPNFLFLLSLSPGSAGEPADVRSANRGIIDINVNGQRTSNNSVSLEGINVNDFNLAHFDTVPLPNTHAIQEFNVSTSLYDASLGSKGGGAVGLVVKHGTKDWHGEAYWDHRNTALNANDWFFNRTKTQRARLLQNVLGFSGSGPVPKAGGYWFANVHGLRARNGIDPSGSVATVTVPVFPTASDGTTSASLIASNPAFGVTAAQVDPTALNILNLKSNLYGGQFLIPRQGQTGCGSPSGGSFTCKFAKVAPLGDTQYTISYDRPFRDGKDRISGRWFRDNFSVEKPFGTASQLAFPRSDAQNNRFLSVHETHQLSNRQINEFRAGYSRFIAPQVPMDPINISDIGATRPNQSTVPGIYRVFVTGAFSFGTGVNDERTTVSNTFYVGDTWSMAKGKHSLKAGGEGIRYQLNRLNRFAIRGDLTFDTFPNFLVGQINSLQSGAGDPQRYFRDTDYAFFFQDDWRLRPTLTVNLGLRWDLFGFAHDKLLRTNIHDPSLLLSNPNANPFEFPANSFLPGITGTPGIGDCGVQNCRDKHDFGPRVGFAWDAFGNRKTVVRGGYGIYFQRLSNQNLLQGALGPPFFVQLITNNPSGVTLQNPIPNQPPATSVAANFIPQASHFTGVTGNGDPNLPGNQPIFVNDAGATCSSPFGGGTATNCSVSLASFSTVTPDAHAPYNQQWNLTVQRELGRGWAVEAGYVGGHSIGGLAIWNPYQAALASPSNPIVVRDTSGRSYTITTNTVNNEPLRHRGLGISRRAGARIDGNVGSATYHSGQLTVSHRFQAGLFFQLGYTYSKEIDNSSGALGTDELNQASANPSGAGQGGGGANVLNSANDLGQNRARGDFDRTHRLVISYNYELPLPKRGPWRGQAFQGWSVSGITTIQSGLPITVSDGTGGRAFGGGISTGVFTCSSFDQALTPGGVQARVDHYLNINCFAPAPTVPNSAGTGGLAPTGFGNTPRNVFPGPRQQTWDFSIAKHFTIRERHSIDFRTDFFNIFNHPSFRGPARVDINTPGTFGQINQTVTPARLIQFGLRYSF